jgi:hypothetical protein
MLLVYIQCPCTPCLCHFQAATVELHEPFGEDVAGSAVPCVTGTGASTSCSVYQKGGQSNVIGLNILQLMGPLIGLTMNMNGEDKENILAMLYCEFLGRRVQGFVFGVQGDTLTLSPTVSSRPAGLRRRRRRKMLQGARKQLRCN